MCSCFGRFGRFSGSNADLSRFHVAWRIPEACIRRKTVQTVHSGRSELACIGRTSWLHLDATQLDVGRSGEFEGVFGRFGRFHGGETALPRVHLVCFFHRNALSAEKPSKPSIRQKMR